MVKAYQDASIRAGHRHGHGEQKAIRGPSASIITRSPKICEDSGVVDFFTNNFVGQDNLFLAPGDFHDMLKNNLMTAGTHAVAFMALGCLKQDAHHYRRAEESYGTALTLLSKAWRSNDGLEHNSTLLAVLFLSFFELLASFDTFRRSWLAHLGGLQGLLKFRRQNGLSTSFDTRITQQTRSQMIHNALQTGIAVPDAVLNNTQGVPSDTKALPYPPGEVNTLLIRLAHLQHRQRCSGFSSDLVAELSILDGDIAGWTESVPTTWVSSPQMNDYDSGLWWDMRHDVYQSRLAAYTWNRARSARLIIYDLIEKYRQEFRTREGALLPGLQNHKANVSVACGIIIDICASVPPCYRPSCPVRDRLEDSRPPTGCALWLLYPLEVLGSVRQTPADMQNWVVRCLGRIRESTGLVKAGDIATRLQNRQGRFVSA